MEFNSRPLWFRERRGETGQSAAKDSPLNAKSTERCPRIRAACVRIVGVGRQVFLEEGQLDLLGRKRQLLAGEEGTGLAGRGSWEPGT